mgnify:CR=1 FL=1
MRRLWYSCERVKIVNTQDKLSELKQFYNELVEFTNLTNQYIRGNRPTKKESEHASLLHVNIERKAGQLRQIVAELSGIDKLDLGGKEYDMWLVALSIPINKRGASALGYCLQATNRAIGRLEDDIRTGKRDAQTGELLTKSGVSGSEPPEALIAKLNWKAIENEFGITKYRFGKKINFISGSFQRSIIFRDVEHSSALANLGFSKPAVILAGGVIEELLRLYLEHKRISPISDNFDGYIRTCEQKGLLKSGISRLSDSVRHFRNLVHLSNEKAKKYTISKATAKNAVSAIFIIANDF